MSTQNQQSLRIFTIISQIEQTLESAPRPKLGGGGRRVVDVDEIFDLLGDLKVTIPEDIRRANSVLIEADTLLEHANQEAVEVVEQAQREAEELHKQSVAEAQQIRIVAEEEFEARVAEDKVMMEVQRRAELLQQHAERNAQVVYNGAKQYADELLQDVQRFLMNYQQMVAQNRAELNVTVSQQAQGSTPEQPAAAVSAPVAAATASAKAAQPAQPVIPRKPQPVDLEEDDEEEEEPRRGLFGWFRRRDEEVFEDEDEEIEDEKPAKTGKRLKRQSEDLDVDLDE